MLATPVMINVIEAAALNAVERLLPAGHQSLGIHLDVTHVAATPVGLLVTATAAVLRVEGYVTCKPIELGHYEPRLQTLAGRERGGKLWPVIPLAALNLYEFFGELPLAAIEEVEHGLGGATDQELMQLSGHSDPRQLRVYLAEVERGPEGPESEPRPIVIGDYLAKQIKSRWA